EFWSRAGWDWLCRAGAQHPVYWRKASRGVWLCREFGQWTPLDENRPVIHVNWFEAAAYCRWAGRRLPTEAEWEWAAAASFASTRGDSRQEAPRTPYPWGEDPPTPVRANLDGASGGTVPVSALAAGDSRLGCRQLMGNVWEWTSSDFLPYPGFSRDPYKDYSQPWFGTHKVLRGGCWLTRSRLIHNLFRNFYTPDRRDVMAGFRTCAVSPA
ncbi:MAG: SUMF1/EgtB/PvdO family nonheme iron enzyme, partial [Acidobacteriota bacterium]